MDPDYIEQLRIAYEDFVKSYDKSPVLVIDTNDLNIVHEVDDLSYVAQRIKSELALGTYQAPLPSVAGEIDRQPQDVLEELEEGTHSLTDFQQFHVSLDAEKGFDSDLFMNFIFLSEEIGELARTLKHSYWTQIEYIKGGKKRDDAQRLALGQHRARIEEELADSLAYLLKLSNYAGIDLENAYLQKMTVNAQRRWQNGHVVEEEE
jgi:NTP pyrophosphatase (non-canonical NTP hydrolase)